jgi:hypothetical protein
MNLTRKQKDQALREKCVAFVAKFQQTTSVQYTRDGAEMLFKYIRTGQ